MAKRDSSGAVKLDKDTTSNVWVMVFKTSVVAAKAAKHIRKFRDKATFLQEGTDVKVEGCAVTLKWHMVVTKKVFEHFWFTNPDRREQLGPSGKLRPWHTELPASSVAVAEPAVQVQASTGQSNYESMPEALKASEFFGHNRSGEMAAALEENGFLIIRKFVPLRVVERARKCVEEHFLEVLKAFHGGYAVQELRDVALVPAFAWNRQPTKTPPHYNSFADAQLWGVATSTGYMQSLGVGQALSAKQYAHLPEIACVQHYPKNLLAELQNVHPEDLCWKEEGVSVKGVGSPKAKIHRDEDDEGRLQCVVMLTEGAVTACPKSHLLPHKASNLSSGHFHVEKSFEDHVKRNCGIRDLAAGPGDLYIFKGGSFVHGSPAVGEADPAPRIVTYSSFWPPGTAQGEKHALGGCSCKQKY